MYSSLHTHHRNLIEITEDKFTGMPRYGGNRKSLDLRIRDLCHHTDLFRIIAQARSQNDRHLRYKIRLFSHTLITVL